MIAPDLTISQESYQAYVCTSTIYIDFQGRLTFLQASGVLDGFYRLSRFEYCVVGVVGT